MSVFALDQRAQFLKGVGPKRAETLSRLGLNTARDVLYHAPRRYEDASTVTPIARVQVGTDVTVLGLVQSKGVLPTRARLRIFQAVLRDESGLIECAWPGQPFLERVIQKGDLLLVTGPVRFFRGRQIQPREFVVMGREGEPAEGKVLPIYPATEGLSQRQFRRILDENLDELLEAAQGEEYLDEAVLRRAGVPALPAALEWIHRPTSLEQADAGRRRLAFEELFFLQLLHARAHRRATAERAGIRFRRTDELIGALYRTLPFELTGAQARVLREIFDDMTSERRMSRLLQGDVGSGKTVVALFAMLLAAENGYQAALMAPTEILAEQHARSVAALIAPLRAGAGAGDGSDGVSLSASASASPSALDPVLLTGRLGARARRDALHRIGSGEAMLVVGTHALIQESVAFGRLGLAVVDEQHRFGVRQRMALAESGEAPDLLVMSATPIPRSLALTVFGDLDISVLDERPPGRQPVRTVVRAGTSREKVYEFVREQVGEGRQAYLVYPLVEESEKVELRAATAEHERLAADVFPELRLGLLHGQLAGEEKDAVMRAFAAGEIDVLVATTVIEVGIDVANASVMVVEHAERFGLSQLHQLRGRVGRRADRSYCVLIAGGDAVGAERLGALVRSDDGFDIARADLRIRGMGDFFGARQHGVPAFRYFDPERDDALLERARDEARRVIDEDPELERHPELRERMREGWAEREKLVDIG